MEVKDTNPKDAVGADKVPMHLWPSTASAVGSIALLNGALKYGRTNWRVAGVRASIYYDAAQRHLNAWFEGEEKDPDDGVDHLGAALACIAILIDSRAADKLNDDRAVQGGYRNVITECTEEVKRLKELHKDHNPKHYTISDNPGTDLRSKLIAKIERDKFEGAWVVNSGNGPLYKDERVDVQFAAGVSATYILASTLHWGIDNEDSDIINWRYSDASN